MRCKKILIGFGGNVYGEREIDFTLRYLAQAHMLVVGALLTDVLIEQDAVSLEDEATKNQLPCPAHKKVHRDRQKLYEYLQDRCKEMSCRSIIHQEGGCTLEELMQEARYADLLVVSQEIYLANAGSGMHTPVSRLLEKCYCPVLVIPAEAKVLEQIVLTFDGSASAMAGIKQFTYVLAGLAQKLPVTVLATYAENSELTAAEEKLFIEYLKQHFVNVALHRVCEGSERMLITAVGLNENALVVVNNPYPQNLPLLRKLLNGAATLHTPLRVFTHGAADSHPQTVHA